jgi:CHAD domain-containing protein
MATLPIDLIARPAVEGARIVALDYLERSRAALARLDDPSDAEALHDFRVALRRLRSTLRAYPAQLRDSVSRKLRRRVRDLTRATNRGRDAEVQLAWLRPFAGDLAPAERVGVRWLVEWIERARETSVEETRGAVRRSFEKLDRQLSRRLGVYRRPVAPVRTAPEPRFGLVAREALVTHAQRLDKLLGAIQAPDDLAAIHRTRIAAKRLRYLLEPFSQALGGAVDLPRSLKSLQNLLGDLHDTQVLEGTVREAVAAAAAERARRHFEATLADGSGAGRGSARRRETPGLLAVARRLRQRRLVDYAKLETTWLGGGDIFAGRIGAASQPLVLPRHGVPVPPPSLRRTTRRPRAGRPR